MATIHGSSFPSDQAPIKPAPASSELNKGVPQPAINPDMDLTMAATTAAATAAQTSAFLALRLPLPGPGELLEAGKKKGHFVLDKPDQKQFKQFESAYMERAFGPQSSRFPEDDATKGGIPISRLGTPIYGMVTLGDPKGDNSYTDAQGRTGNYKTLDLDCALVEVNFQNHVVVTNIQGLNSSIKEYVSSGDADITITGIYNSTPGVAPMEFIKNMKAMFDAPVPIPVKNYYLNKMDIHYIVIMPGTTMGQKEGGYASQTYTIKAISDVPQSNILP